MGWNFFEVGWDGFGISCGIPDEFEMGYPMAKDCATCATISWDVNCRLNPITPVKQNLQSTGQPT